MVKSKCGDCGAKGTYEDQAILWGRITRVKRCSNCYTLRFYKTQDGKWVYGEDLVV